MSHIRQEWRANITGMADVMAGATLSAASESSNHAFIPRSAYPKPHRCPLSPSPPAICAIHPGDTQTHATDQAVLCNAETTSRSCDIMMMQRRGPGSTKDLRCGITGAQINEHLHGVGCGKKQDNFNCAHVCCAVKQLGQYW